MAFSINTNLASLQAQEYLRVGTDFQSKTINRVTSGLRILSSGDDAAGLAIANGIRSDRAVLMQGIRNANDGLSALQTIDGGLNNISQLLDRARTLAAQSASGLFSGSRAVLNSEFSNVLEEIDRQAQAIGLNQNGDFAKSLSVFIGGGRASGGVSVISNGSVGVDLRTSTVDTLSLGLKGVQAGNTGYDLSAGTTAVDDIVADATNTGSLATANHTVFRFFGPGFGDADGIDVSVNINNVASTDDLVSVINSSIALAGEGATSAAAAFKAAGITAKVVTDADGKQQLAFSSSKAAFQVYGGDRMANALLGNYSAGATGAAIATTVDGAQAGANAFTGAETHYYRITGGGLDQAYNFTFASVAETQAAYGLRLAAAVAADSTLAAAGITVSNTDPTSATGLQFTAANGEKLSVQIANDTGSRLGFGAFQLGAGNAVEYATFTTGTDAGMAGGENTRFTFSFNGGAGIDVNVAWTAQNVVNDVTKAAAINAAINNVAALQGLELTASFAADAVTFTSGNGTLFRLQVTADDAAADFGSGLNSAVASYAGPNQSNALVQDYIAAGSYQLVNTAGTATPLSFSAINYASDDQSLTIQANDALGAAHSIDITLTSVNAQTIDEALNTINQALQLSNDETLKKITAVKVNDGGAEKVTLVSTLSDFRLSVGKNASGTGLDQTALLVSSGQVGAGANSVIDTQAGAEAAVSALADAVTTLGSAQAVVGRGQNQFNYAVSLASTQLTNLAASESRIRDADLAMEAANLTKAQVLLQAGIAALAQANAAPQAVLSLLRG
jgi:flagellin